MSKISEKINIGVCVGIVLLILLPAGRVEGASDNESKLLKLAGKKFPSLTKDDKELEKLKKLFHAVVNGQVADYSDKLVEENNDPNTAKDWDPNTRVIRADRIGWLCTDPEASQMVAHKGIWVKGARIDGELDLSYARISFPLSFKKSAFPKGIYLRYAEIRELFLSGTHTGPISADGLKVEGDVFLREGFKAQGEVRLVGATIGGGLYCEKGQFINKGEKAINADGMKVEGGVFLREGFTAKGEVELIGATIGGYFVWTDVNSPEEAILDLKSATIGTLWDDANSWPEKGKLFLNNFEYKEIFDDAPRTAKERIKWLRRQYDDKAEKDKDQFCPQPYEQLAEVFRKSGQDEDARKVLIAKNEERARLAKTWSEKFWYRVLGPTIGYGYRPLNALWGMAAFVALGWVLFGIGYWGGLITPQSESAYVAKNVGTADAGAVARELSDVYPKFNFLVYSIDTFVPLIDLHQGKYWLPNANRGPGLLNIKTGGLLRLYLWIHITMGWALTMLLVAGLTGLVRT